MLLKAAEHSKGMLDFLLLYNICSSNAISVVYYTGYLKKAYTFQLVIFLSILEIQQNQIYRWIHNFKSTIFHSFFEPIFNSGSSRTTTIWMRIPDNLMQRNWNNILINVKCGPHIASALWQSSTLCKWRLRYYSWPYYYEIRHGDHIITYPKLYLVLLCL